MEKLKTTTKLIFASLLCVSAFVIAADYSRDEFGHGWNDADGDCQDARQETLISQGDFTVDLSSMPSICSVRDLPDQIEQSYYLPYSDQTVTDQSLIDIDHVVPLKHAFDHGADEWTEEKRIQFANDPDNLFITHRSVNRSKGSKAPNEWMPPNEEFHQEYLERWMMIKGKYGLNYSPEELQFLNEQLEFLCE